MQRPFLLAALLFLSCSRPAKHPIDRVTVSGATVSENPILGMNADAVQALFEEKLKGTGHFTFPEAEEKAPPGAVHIQIELSFTREAQKEGRKGTWAEVGATGQLKKKEEGETRHYEVVGLGEVAEEGESADARKKAVQQALSDALEQIVASSDLLLTEQSKGDKELEKDLKSSDARAHEFALRTLAERGNPVVVDALIEKLKGTDPDEVHRAIGALVEMKERRAVPALIDLARNRDPAFIREIVFALGTIGGDEAEAYLFTVASGSDEPEVQAAAEQAMSELRAKKDPRSKNAE